MSFRFTDNFASQYPKAGYRLKLSSGKSGKKSKDSYKTQEDASDDGKRVLLEMAQLVQKFETEANVFTDDIENLLGELSIIDRQEEDIIEKKKEILDFLTLDSIMSIPSGDSDE